MGSEPNFGYDDQTTLRCLPPLRLLAATSLPCTPPPPTPYPTAHHRPLPDFFSSIEIALMAGANIQESTRVAYDALTLGWAVKVPGTHDNTGVTITTSTCIVAITSSSSASTPTSPQQPSPLLHFCHHHPFPSYPTPHSPLFRRRRHAQGSHACKSHVTPPSRAASRAS